MNGTTKRARVARLAKLLPAVGLMILLLPSAPATAQATRTWVSGVGDDANPCSRTAPCKTFAGAISKTAANGEINALDPGGFGGVTINKSLTINACAVGQGGVLVSGTNAIVINAGVNDRIVLECLDINGLGNSLDGIRFIAGKSLKVVDTEIFGFARNGINLISSTVGAKAFITRNFIHDNGGNGVMIDPPNGGFTKATLRNNNITDNACGITTAQFGPDPGFNFALNCGTSGAGSGISGSALVNDFENAVTENTSTGILSRGANAIQRLGLNEVTNNTTGLLSVDNGGLLSFGNNMVTGNSTNGASTGTAGPLLRPER